MFNLKKKSSDAIFLTFLLLALLIFFKDALLGKRTLIYDAGHYFYPYFFTVSSYLRNLHIPLWNPFLFDGFPTIANIEAQIFYPINFFFLPFTSFTPYVIYVSVILHLLLAGVFMFLLGKHLLGNRWASFIASLVYMFSGFMVGHFEHVTIIDVMVWLPLIFLLLDKAITEKKLPYSVFAGFFLGVSFLAGHPQTSHAMVFILIVHAIYRATTIYLKEKKMPLFLNSLSALVICLVIALLIAVVQILPTYELVQHSIRNSPVSFDVAAKSGQFTFSDAILLILPNYYGALTGLYSGLYWGNIDISQSIIYIGVIPLLLIGLSVLSTRNRPDIIYFLVIAVFFLLLSLGENGPVFRFVYEYVPGFKYFRSPVHPLFVFTFCAALLSGYGFSVINDKLKISTFLIYLFIFSMFCVVLYLLSQSPPDMITLEASRNIKYGMAVFITLLFLSGIIITFCMYYPRFRNICYVVLLLLTFTDLYINFSDATTLGEKNAPSSYEKAPKIITLIKQHSGIIDSGDKMTFDLNEEELKKGLFRIYTKPEGLHGTLIFGYNRAMLFRTFLIEGFEPLDMSRHRKLVQTLAPRNLDNFLKITNSKYITNTKDFQNIDVDYEYYPYSLPRAFIVNNAKFLDNDDMVLDELATFNPSSEVVISGKGQDIVGQNADSARNTIFKKYTSDLLEISTQSKQDGFLVLSDTYYPGWQAWVDGVESAVLRANYDFRAISLPKGEHTVIFKFKSRYLKLGLLISSIGIFIVFLSLIYQIRKTKLKSHR